MTIAEPIAAERAHHRRHDEPPHPTHLAISQDELINLPKIEVDELAELVYEAWRLSAPAHLVEEHPLT